MRAVANFVGLLLHPQNNHQQQRPLNKNISPLSTPKPPSATTLAWNGKKGEGLSLAIQQGSCSTNESGPAKIWLRCIKTRQMMVREIVNPQKLSKNIYVPAGNLTMQSYCLSWGQCQLFVQQWQRHAGCFPVNIPAVNDGPESIELSCVNTGMLKFQFPGGLGFTNFDLWWHVVPVHI